MCSILGGTKFNMAGFLIYEKAKDRGRDFTGLVEKNGYWICNHRATPTNETERPNTNQPFGEHYKLVHNGTVANDAELGVPEGELDSMAFLNVLDVTDVRTVAESLKKIVGSYAIAILKDREIILACNYKPIFYAEVDGEHFFSSLANHFPVGCKPHRMKPYSVMNLVTKDYASIERKQSNDALVICSGGLDSTSVIGYAMKNHNTVKLLHFDYGCRATKREVEAIENICKELDVTSEVVKLEYSKLQGQSTLFKDEEITSGKSGVEFALDWVYARNLIMLSLAVGYAEANNFGTIYLGTNLEESGAYPDNEEQFIRDFNNLLYGAVNNGTKIEIKTPLGGLMKREIVEFGIKHNSPIHLSWSCYNNNLKHCGQCGPCYMRKKAFARAGVVDLTEYKN